MSVLMNLTLSNMKRKSYAKDHVTVRFSFEEVAHLVVALRGVCEASQRQLSLNLASDVQDIIKHRNEVLKGIADLLDS